MSFLKAPSSIAMATTPKFPGAYVIQTFLRAFTFSKSNADDASQPHATSHTISQIDTRAPYSAQRVIAASYPPES